MAEKREINPLMKTALELGPVIAFFIAYVMLKDDTFTIGGRAYSGFILVTAGFVPLIVITTGILWKLTGHLSKMQIMTLLLVVIFGGLTVWLNDPKFIKMKPTILYTFFGGALGLGLLRGQSYLRHVMEGMMPLKDEGWMILTRRMMIFFFGLAVANELVWRLMSESAWVNFKTFGLTAALFAFFMGQSRLLHDYGIDDEGET
ncbi:inner membrane-spanning protein YciB [Lentibacter sp. XHP0401]|jgi:intracellular septation protein|uniref:inner membrane-spanning protein YciB n=1 Tax=Lentibacter sp. XHP0401 TaxID=2984334 RepID=UPI0021E8125D|nr:inner membrane-spanning protein YciB [Lentibacter sp. XHP0401]MCV2894611.1 septation protein IspZ [Lentibacter sp. XHP0401]